MREWRVWDTREGGVRLGREMVGTYSLIDLWALVFGEGACGGGEGRGLLLKGLQLAEGTREAVPRVREEGLHRDLEGMR